MREVEKQISDLKRDQFHKLTRPVDAFITFEEEDGYIIAQEFEPEIDWLGKKKPAKMLFLEDDLFLHESTEPTNIIWENRHWTAADYFRRTLQVVAIIAGLLVCSFLAIYFCKSYAIENARVYPVIKADNIFKNVFNSNYDNLRTFGTQEYNDFVQDGAPLAGYYQTYCAINGKYEDFENATTYNYTHDPICNRIFEDKMKTLSANQAVTIGIVAINFILRMIIIKLIIYIGKDTESEQTRLITNGVFIVQFFNTALLLLLVNANMSEQGSFFKLLSKDTGIPDFNSQWFNEIGSTLVAAMLFNVYWPVIEFFVFAGIRTLKRMLDSKSFAIRRFERTKTTNIQLYIEIYSGPVFFIHYKYSSILNITFVTMMYGLGLPVLFPVAAISLLVLYCVEKLMLHYSYREPPMYDEKLNKNALAILTWAPLLFCSFGYWMLSSLQLLSNDHLPELTYSDTDRTSGHYVSSVFSMDAVSASNVGMPLLLTFWFLVITIPLRNYIYGFLTTVLPFLQIAQFEVDEGLPNYFETIDEQDRNWSIKEEENAREVLGMSILDEDTLYKFRNTKLGEGHMKGTHCYDILANELYLDDFQYFSAALGDERAAYIKDDDEDESNDNAQSDLVKMALNLAFMPEERGKNFTFDKSFYSERQKLQSFRAPHGIN